MPTLSQVRDATLGTEPARRRAIERTLIAALMYAACLGLLGVTVRLQLADASAAQAAALAIACGPPVFYAALRSGWTRRLADPALTLMQMLFAVSTVILAYAVVPPTRSATLLILAPIMTFGMFSLSPAQARGLTVFTLAAFGVAMAGLCMWRPTTYDARLELIHFVVLAAVLPTIATLSGQLARLRTRRRQQRAELQTALERLEQLVRHDALTGLVNRRCMQELLDAEQKRRVLAPQPACICLIDLDHFKRINDDFGHAAGDEVLRRFAQQAAQALRATDVLARWGGEEFLLLLPGADLLQADRALARLSCRLADEGVWQDHPRWRVSFSAGVAAWRGGELPGPAIERADRAAYRAKAKGRGCWYFDDDDDVALGAAA